MREFSIAAAALIEMRSAGATREEQEAIRTTIYALRSNVPDSGSSSRLRLEGPSMGYRIAFLEPPTYRIDVGRFRVHYRFDDETVRVGYIGVY